MSAERPFVSVVVPVRDRRALLLALLDSLERQTYPRERFEVVVVDDGSRDGSGDAAVVRGGERGLDVRVALQPPLGAVAARNRGAAEARGEVLAFTDSDCRPEPEWLAEGVRALTAADLAQGVTVPDPTMPRGPLHRTVEAGPDSGLFDSCNVFFRTAAFREAGGFDEVLSPRLRLPRTARQRDYGFGEDSELAWRMIRRGHAASPALQAVVRHHVFEPDLAETAARTWLVGAFPSLVRELPELAGTLLHRGVFLSRVRPWVYLAVFGAARARRRPAWLLAALPYLVSRYRASPGSRRQRLAALPVLAALDLVATAGLLAGSIAARRIVL